MVWFKGAKVTREVRTARGPSEEQRKRIAALSSNKKGFTNPVKVQQQSYGQLMRSGLLDDEDIRLERYKDGHDVDLLGASLGGFKRDMTILEESPNGYEVTGDAPPDHEFDWCINHYSQKLRQFTSAYPCEWALCHWSLGKVFLMDRRDTGKRGDEKRAKKVENALFHFDKALQWFTHENYPQMWSIICLAMGQLYRERVSLTKGRSFLTQRGTAMETLHRGLDNILEAMTVISNTKRLEFEHVIASVQMGWLYMLMGEEPGDDDERTVLFDQAVTHTERGLAAAEALHKTFEESENKRFRSRDPDDVTRHPPHIRSLLAGRSLSHVEGMGMYVLGRAYASLSPQRSDQERSFEYYNRALKPKFLAMDDDIWVDAHIRLANVILDTPTLVDPNFVEEDTATESGYGVLSLPSVADGGATSKDGSPSEKSLQRTKSLNRMNSFRRPKNASGGFLVETETKSISDSSHFDSAITHLQLVMRSPAAAERVTEIQFAIAQVNLSKLHVIIDRIPPGQSLTTGLLNSGGNDVIDTIIENLQDALDRITGAEQNSQNAYIYFFACLKMSELKMLQTASRRGLEPWEKQELLEESVHFLGDALVARSVHANPNLHYISMVQMSQMLQATQRFRAVLKVAVKILLCMSVEVLRGRFTSGVEPHTFRKEVDKQCGVALQVGLRLTRWIRKHLPPFEGSGRLSQPAVWSFEEMPEHEKEGTDGLPEDPREAEEKSRQAHQLAAAAAAAAEAAAAAAKTPEKEKKTKRLRSKVAKENAAELDSMARIENALARGEIGASPPKRLPPVKAPPKLREHVEPTAPTIDENVARSITTEDKTKPALKNKKGEEESDYMKAQRGDAVPWHKIPAMGLNFTRATMVVEKDEFGAHVHRVVAPEYGVFSPYMLRVRPLVPFIEMDRAKRILKVHEDTETKRLYLKEKRRGDVADGLLQPRHLETHDDRVADMYRDGPGDGRAPLTGRSSLESSFSGTARSKAGSKGPGQGPAIRTKPEPMALTSANIDHFTRGLEVEKPVRRGILSRIFGRRQRPKRPPTLEEIEERDRMARKVFRPDTGPGWNVEGESDSDSTASDLTLPFEIEPESRGVYGWLKRLNREGKRTALDREQLIAERETRDVRLWASDRCHWAAMVLSRQSRLNMLELSARLAVGRGERARVINKEMPKSLVETLHTVQKRLRKSCAKLDMPPLNLKQLSRKSYDEIAFLFKDQVTITRSLKELEEIYFHKFHHTAPDSAYFFPLTCSVASMTRHISGYDDKLLTADILLKDNKVFDERPPTPPRPATPPSSLIHSSEVDDGKGGMKTLTDGGTGPMKKRVKKKAKDKLDGTESTAEEKDSTVNPAPTDVAVVGVDPTAVAGGVGDKHLEAREPTLEDVLSHSLDGCGTSLREVLEKHLSHHECLLWWHLPPNPSHNMQCIMAWRAPHQDGPKGDAREKARREGRVRLNREDRKKAKKKAKEAKRKERADKSLNSDRWERLRGKDITTEDDELEDGIVMELCKSDVKGKEIVTLIQELARSLKTRPFKARWEESELAIRALSQRLSMTELVQIFPSHLANLVVCCPPVMRLVPWGALLVEAEGYETVVEAPLIERYNLRLGPSLSFMELTAMQGGRIKHAIGNFEMTLIDGSAETPRDFDIELQACSSSYTKDIDHINVLGAGSASPTVLSSQPFMEVQRDLYRKKVRIRDKRKAEHSKKVAALEKRKAMEELERKKHRIEKGRMIQLNKDKAGSDSDEEYAKQTAMEQEKALREEADEEDNLSVDSTFEENQAFAARCLKSARVLHVCAPRSAKGTHAEPAIALPPEEGGAEDGRTTFTAADMVRQWHLPNCALCVLSRFGMYDALSDVRQCLGGLEMIEATHLVGAATTIFPLWSGSMNGMHGTVANTLILTYMYAQLPNESTSPLPVTTALRKAQLWLRDSTWEQLTEWVRLSHLPETMRLSICSDLERVWKQYQRETGIWHTADKRIFRHFIFWSNQTVSGFARNVLPTDVATEDVESKRSRFAALMFRKKNKPRVKMEGSGNTGTMAGMGKLAVVDHDIKKKEQKGSAFSFGIAKTISDRAKFRLRQEEMYLEAEVLKVEGKWKEAKLMRQKARAEKKERDKVKYRMLYNTFAGVYNNIASGVDAMLDSDSEDSEHIRRKEEEEEKARTKTDILKEGRATMGTLAGTTGQVSPGMGLLSSPNVRARTTKRSKKELAAAKYVAKRRGRQAGSSEGAGTESDSDSGKSSASASSLSGSDNERGGGDRRSAHDSGMSEDQYNQSFRYYSTKDSIYGKDSSQACTVM